MNNVWAISGTQDEPNASMDRRSQFSHARRAADFGCRDYDRSDCLGYDWVLARARLALRALSLRLRSTLMPGPPMTLGNMRDLGVRNLIAYCLNDACRHTALIDVSN
jgi:hypothetical protein